jgi:hypothetical protein
VAVRWGPKEVNCGGQWSVSTVSIVAERVPDACVLLFEEVEFVRSKTLFV